MRIEIPGLMLGFAMLAACADASQDASSEHASLQDSCEAMVAAKIDVPPSEVRAVSTQKVPHGTLITVEVTDVAAPWVCGADPSGVILGVEYSAPGSAFGQVD
ncbi:hypothetical protein M3P21_13470 [Ruegeria sp. 2012CJ41-6]|uniref:Uncharacterized protein n=1 Tax=Ruegeria spongiae TaxID=2942209 RepID=A0ABT0Q6N4_9RHOB|nr:hypothetical protein [Ruegeria spongiae]MCL6284539.1 hypothetical protein [Ruegeria spongiae]